MSAPTPRTDAKLLTVAQRTSPNYLPEMVYADFARTLERELNESRNAERLARVQLAAERARLADLVADLNDACITLASAAEDCDDYAMQNTGFKLTAVREVLLQHIPNAAMKEGA